MSKTGVSFEDMKKDMMKDEEFKIEYDKLRPRYMDTTQILLQHKIVQTNTPMIQSQGLTKDNKGENLWRLL